MLLSQCDKLGFARPSSSGKVEAEIRESCEKVAVDEASCALVYYAEEWHRGVLGIVASRMVERLYRPVFVLSRNPEDGTAQGSGRSIPAFHLLQALEAMPGQRQMDGGALLEYFAPLQTWLKEQNKGQACGW